MVSYLASYFSGMGFSPLMIAVLFAVMIWDLVWKLKAMWKAAKNNSAVWFVALMLFNTAGILPIIYLYAFSPREKHSAEKRKVRRKRR